MRAKLFNAIPGVWACLSSRRRTIVGCSGLWGRNPDMDSYGDDGSFAVFQILGLIIALVIPFLIGKDASSRGMSGIGWGIFTFLLCIVAVPVYLVVRKPRPGEPQ